MRRDILFFVKGVPPERCICSPGVFFMQPVPDQMLGELHGSSKTLPLLHAFLGKQAGATLLVGFRNDHPDEQTAVDRAYRGLEGIFDGLSFILDDHKPQVCSVIKIREGNAPGAKLVRYVPHTWIHLQRAGSDSPAKWKLRCDKLFNRLHVFFALAAAGEPTLQNELGHQVVYSAKMFRYGDEARSFGVEYLCKFSALEGLVCGAAKRKKNELLNTRLTGLFKDGFKNVSRFVSELWTLRCEASHQAKAFYDETLPGSNALQCRTVGLEHLMTGALVFALDHLGKVATINELWSRVSAYTLPEYARIHRPDDMQKLALVNFIEKTRFDWPDAGSLIDEIHAGHG